MLYYLFDWLHKLNFPGAGMFGYTSLNDLPELPRYKLDENQQIVIDDLVESVEKEGIEENEIK